MERERLERRRSAAGGTGEMKDAGGVQHKGDDAGDAKQEWRDGRERLERQRDAAQRGQLELTEMIPRSAAQLAESSRPLAQERAPAARAGAAGAGRGTGAPTHCPCPCPCLCPCPGVALPGPAHPSLPSPAQLSLPSPGSPGVSPQHRGVPPGCRAAPEPLGPHRALELLHPRQPLRHHHVAQGKSPCNIKIHPESLQMQIKPITGKNTLGRPENK